MDKIEPPIRSLQKWCHFLKYVRNVIMITSSTQNLFLILVNTNRNVTIDISMTFGLTLFGPGGIDSLPPFVYFEILLWSSQATIIKFLDFS